MVKEYSRPSALVLLEAAEIQEKKGQDYNNAVSSVQQADYYTYGVWSLLDTIHAKYLRMKSVLETMEAGGKVNYESVKDSAIDMINYASFLAAYLDGDVPGQKPDRDIFNNIAINPNLLPTKFRENNNG